MNDPKSASSTFLPYACPTCKLTLARGPDSSLECEQCGAHYPFVDAALPILVSTPYEHIAGERYFLKHDANQLKLASEYYLAEAKNTGIRRETLAHLGQGLLHNANLLTRFAAALPHSDLQVEEHGMALGANLFAALRKDWSGFAETENEVAAIFETIDNKLAKVQPSTTLVLGAGTGRTLCMIDEKYSGTYGIDLSTAMGTAFRCLDVDRQLDAYLLQQGNFLRAADECELIRANRDLTGGTPKYAIADAASLPFGDASFDAVVANYFTDMLPLSLWLPEVVRVLKPTGQFIHYGPLGYAFPHIAEHYAADQLPIAFTQFGLQMSEPEFIRSSFYGSSKRLNRFDFDNLLFTAKHISDG